MNVQMRDGFASVLTVVDDETKAFFGAVKSKIRGNFSCRKQQMTEEGLIPDSGLSHSRDRLLRNHENMSRCLRGNIAEGESLIIFVDDVSRNLAGDDFLEERHD